MTKIFLSTLAVAGLLSGSAWAADAALPYNAAAPVPTCAADQFRRVYVGLTGGAAAGHFKTTYASQFLGFPGFFVSPGPLNSATNDEWRWGLVAGFGTEWAWTDRISIRSEVLYVDFVDRSKRFLFAPTPPPG